MFIQRVDKQSGRGIGGALLVVMLLVACAGGRPAPERSSHIKKPTPRDFGPEIAWQEIDVPMPSFPRGENLAEFTIDRATRYKFFVDTKSVRVDTDGVARYAVVARSSAGAENVSFEGIRCQTSEFKIYAFGSPDQTWSPARNRKWTGIEKSRDNAYRYSLHRYYLCPGGSPRRNVSEAIAALERGYPEVSSGH